MPDVSPPLKDSAIDAVASANGRRFAIEEWKSTQESITSFNDLGLRVRVFGIGGVFVVAGYGIQSIKDDQLLFACLHSSALIVCISLVLLIAVWLFDLHYYTPLLISAVVYGQELERALRGEKEILDRGALERMNDTDTKHPDEKKHRPDTRRSKTYIWGKTTYISYYVSRVHSGLFKSLWALYGILGIVLLLTAALIQFGHRISASAGYCNV